MANESKTYDVAVVGGGVIGLSIAWELADAGAGVIVADRCQPGRAASWAGAGIVPPGPDVDHFAHATALERLAGLSAETHPLWHRRLLEQTGIDNGYRKSGGLYLFENKDDARAAMERRTRLGIDQQPLDRNALGTMAPALAGGTLSPHGAVFVPDESQIRNPRHLRALLAACRANKVDIFADQPVRSFRASGERVTAAVCENHVITADHFCLTAGCWSGALASELGIAIDVQPVRGQMALLKGPAGVLRQVVNAGRRYLVPRDDGHLLVGSTEEQVGFDDTTTSEGVDGLVSFAAQIAPPLAELPLVGRWAGLRPGRPDRQPLLGRAGSWQNVWLATGHFRAGLQLSTGTALVMSALLRGERPPLDLPELAPHDAGRGPCTTVF